MDQQQPFLTFFIERVDFSPEKFKVYQDGQLKKQGSTSMIIRMRTKNQIPVCQDNIQVSIENNNLTEILDSTALFDTVMSLHDRLIALILPEQTNIQDTMFALFKQVVACTRYEKFFKEKEPICMSIFTDNGYVVKMSFKVYSPETLIELSI